eukprot:NODE_1681_length_771_cov_85.565217_g1632_i0.p1 GENE.NODE_1681_length_771_cov_85.565217_g1632_i0~~NODE_1681_length_771_cov_85.565217_g1632_i0.p1  ORF type:complete len:187 (-),score=22.48 NODE_1681_length_771_cov_85.565217_g1632_i0:120-680(-)
MYGHRKLRPHEAKLLKKHDNFLNWPSKRQKNPKYEAKVIEKACLQRREDYTAYHKILGKTTSLMSILKNLPPNSKPRIEITKQLCQTLHDLGVMDSTSLEDVEKIKVFDFAKRRLPLVMCALRMAPSVPLCTKYVQQGHVRVGPDQITDPAYLVPRKLQDYVTWMPGSKIKATVDRVNLNVDDYNT